MNFNSIIHLLKIANENKPNTITMCSEPEDYANAKNQDYKDIHPKLAKQYKYVHELIDLMKESPEKNQEIDELFEMISDGILRYHNQDVIIQPY